MKFEIKMDKEQLVEMGKGLGKIGKAIVIEGTKAVAIKGATAVISQSFEGGLGSVKDLELETIINGGKKEKKSKKPFISFKRKKKIEEDEVIEDLEMEVETQPLD